MELTSIVLRCRLSFYSTSQTSSCSRQRGWKLYICSVWLKKHLQKPKRISTHIPLPDAVLCSHIVQGDTALKPRHDDDGLTPLTDDWQTMTVAMVVIWRSEMLSQSWRFLVPADKSRVCRDSQCVRMLPPVHWYMTSPNISATEEVQCQHGVRNGVGLYKWASVSVCVLPEHW